MTTERITPAEAGAMLASVSAGAWTRRDTETHAEIDAPDHKTLAMVATGKDADAIAAVPRLLQTIIDMGAELEADKTDAERFRALMRCPRIKMQGSAGVNPKTGDRLYPDTPGQVHFGAEFWPGCPSEYPQDEPTWGRHALRALADDILAWEARAAITKGGE